MEKGMLHILLVGEDPTSLEDFAAALSRLKGVKVSRAISGRKVCESLERVKVDVVVAGEKLADGAALPFVYELTRRQPLINCAMVSSLPPKEFHELTEGLGVFMQLPVDPGAKEVDEMFQLLESIDALMGSERV